MSTVWGPVSPTTSAISTAIAAASSGDTILVDSGEETWVGAVTVDKNLSIIGAGIGNTVITHSSLAEAFIIGTTTSRISGFEFVSGRIVPNGQGWRIDHCKFTHTAFEVGIYPKSFTAGYPPKGLIDNCTLHNLRVLVCGAYTTFYDMCPIWTEPLGLGTDNAVFVEDCTFTTDAGIYANAVDTQYGGRYVCRYNTLTDRWLEAHGIAGTARNTRSFEIYENTITQSACTMYHPFMLRGGTGVVYNNTIAGTWGRYSVDVDCPRSCTAYGEGGLADGTSLWDGNTDPIGTYEGWPVRDQIGRSTDSWLWTAGNPYPPQASDPVYCWDNVGPGSIEVPMAVLGCARTLKHIIEDRDFFNGTAKSGYTPYTYPHPLQTEQDFEPTAGETVTCSDTIAVQETKPPSFGSPSKFTRAFY